MHVTDWELAALEHEDDLPLDFPDSDDQGPLTPLTQSDRDEAEIAHKAAVANAEAVLEALKAHKTANVSHEPTGEEAAVTKTAKKKQPIKTHETRETRAIRNRISKK